MSLARVYRSLSGLFGAYPIVTIIAVTLLSSFLLYLPFATHTLPYFGFDVENRGMQYIYQNYDGILYIVPAKSWYNPKAIENIRLEFNLPLEYYAAHLPLYPLFISFAAPVFGYLQSMIGVNLAFSVLLAVFFYYFLKYFKITEHPLPLTIIFLFLPRFFVLRSVGAPESLFLLLILLSVFFFEKKQYFYAGILGAFATMTKLPGILLFVAYLLVIGEDFLKRKKFDPRSLFLGFIPLGLVAVFGLYAIQYNNFFAYFNTGGVVPMPYPFAVFNFQARWVNDLWLEDIVFYFFLYGMTVMTLWQSKFRSFFYFSVVYFVLAVFVQHRDLSRYMLPLWPFAVMAFEKIFSSPTFRTVFWFLLPAIYLYAINFTLYNILPISDWRPFI